MIDKNFLENMLYFCWAEFSLTEKKDIGLFLPLMCCKTTPTAFDEAFVVSVSAVFSSSLR